MTGVDTLRLALVFLSAFVCVGMLWCAWRVHGTRMYGCITVASYAFWTVIGNVTHLSTAATVATYGFMLTSIGGLIYIVRVYDELQRKD